MERVIIPRTTKRTISFTEASFRANRNHSLHGPLRVLRLCVLSVIFPGILVGVPLYMRYFVYGEQVYPVGMSDMRLVDHRISTTWCQSQTVWSNATFNAYLMDSQPQFEKEYEHLHMTRDLTNLEDDMKEYWGFYLLKGSVITVSTCARYPGASLILIRGHKHLRNCAYIGDDSSEEIEEMYPDDGNNTVHQDPPNKPEKMTKMSDGVVVYGQMNTAIPGFHHKKISSSMSNSISRIHKPKKVLKTGLKRGNKIHLAFAELGNKLVKYNFDLNKLKSNNYSQTGYSNNENEKSTIDKSSLKLPTTESSSLQSSREIYEKLIKRMKMLGDKGKRVLDKLRQFNETTSNSTNSEIKKTTDSPEIDLKPKHKLRHLRKLLKVSRNENKTEITDEIQRKRREILLNNLHNPLIQDEESDTAMEEDIHQPDEIADIRGTVNETTAYDKSNSEFWSSFSSSEERLLNCEGLLVNLPLMPHERCSESLEDEHHSEAFAPNSITYKVTSNGYYFFVFNSENEVKPNFLRIHFRLEKTTYDVSKPLASCKNQTTPCSLPLSFWSQQKVVLQLPVRTNDALWNQEFLAISTCEPRTSVYIACVIAVPLFIILFAFQ
ncbi:uncharacterized protein LOC142321412 isoform X2 [Lycorma delicatula]|uniref:uncharacterized protein LOC142321412 isoform X2 n=1 Tax=Lycorma delicatula TaxID=130591 RepID=UPI003F50D9A5